MSASPAALVVVAYDVTDDQRRARMAAWLLAFGGRIQGSVYELWLDERQLERMWAGLDDLAAPDDLVRCYVLCAACKRRIRSCGLPPPVEATAYIV
ncbi:MAG: CRISPR-associated endonuclease Cas2 [Chloroflexi bacterium]|nr:CRISPR-associated endonuclease Cas2 [Chloroflexota bacterium]